jgi:hypothetical protein
LMLMSAIWETRSMSSVLSSSMPSLLEVGVLVGV